MKKKKKGVCRYQMVATDPGIYIDTVSKTYHWRPVVNGKRTSKAFGTTQIAKARLLYAEILDKQSRVDNKLSPKEETKPRLLITEAVGDYERSGFSSIRHGIVVKPGDKHIVTEKSAVVSLNEFFKGAYADELIFAKLVEYKEWRVQQAKKVSHVGKEEQGTRAVDLDLNTLSKALDWAVVKTLKLAVNPIKFGRTHFYNKKKSRKTKEVCPDSPELFWKVAGLLFEEPDQGPSSVVIGWQWMWEGINGMRTKETITLRRDAESAKVPGFLQGRTIYSIPGKKDGTTKAFYLTDEALILKKAMDAWAEKCRPKSPYFFPGRADSRGYIGDGSLTHRLDELHEAGDIPVKLTGHGARGFRVLVDRSNGKKDIEIAASLNQEGGVETLQESYGMIPEEWRNGGGPKYNFLPKNPKKYPWAGLFKKLGIKVAYPTAPRS